MTYFNPDAEEVLENAILALFRQLGWTVANAYHEVHGDPSNPPAGTGLFLGRETRQDVILRPRLFAALRKLNPGLPPEAFHAAVEELTRGRGAMTLVAANRQIDDLLKEGVGVTFMGEDGAERFEKVQVIDWKESRNNDFLMVQQLWVAGELYTRRADLVGFVNGIPLLFGELKAHHRRLEDAYRDNFQDYQDTIPHLFWYNAIVLLSNGSDARLGTITAKWEHFAPWKKIDDEREPAEISVETLVRGTCPPERFLDIVENYLLFHEDAGGTSKIVAKYHQYLGVENAIRALRGIRQRQGRLGVFWHTQGSGKSFSMVFFSRKVLRKVPGNWTFVVVTDRVDLDDQIYKTFARSGVVTEAEQTVRSQSGSHLKELLQEDHRYVFTLIQKFYTRHGESFPKLSDRSDIIVLTDEAHRSQYDDLARNMRQALPNAAFLAFTATPLLTAEQETRRVFGDYVSVYTYKQSNEDQATVPLFYENRVPELQLTNDEVGQQIAALVEEAEFEEREDRVFESQFRDAYNFLTADDRLDKIAQDIVRHFVNRGFLGKAMVVSIDKLTTVTMYEKVRKHWNLYLDRVKARVKVATGDERDELVAQIAFMEETDMAVVVSEEQGEVAKFRQAGLDIVPHRRRMKTESLDEKFKAAQDPFRLVFVCAMWRTGFDAPACSTIYLDRPMANHTLMQTIARANRVWQDKAGGLIIDYVGVFRDLKRALAIYGTGPSGALGEGEQPVERKAAQVEDLRKLLAETEAFCAGAGVDLAPILRERDPLHRYALMDAAVASIVAREDRKIHYLGLAQEVDRLYRAILPDPRAGEFGSRRKLLVTLAAKIRSLDPSVDVSETMDAVRDLLDKSIEAREYVIGRPSALKDLSQLDFEALRRTFEHGNKHLEVERLHKAAAVKIGQMIERNRTRMNYQAELQRMLDEYNAGSRNADEMFDQVVDLIQRLNTEERRHMAEHLSEEELALYDLIRTLNGELSPKEEHQVKAAVRHLLEVLKREKLVLDWRDRQQALAGVRVTIRDLLYQELPARYTPTKCDTIAEQVFVHVHEKYPSAADTVYTRAA